MGVKLWSTGQIWPAVYFYLAPEARPNDYESWPAGVRVRIHTTKKTHKEAEEEVFFFSVNINVGP